MKYVSAIVLFLISGAAISAEALVYKDGRNQWIMATDCYPNNQGGYSATINGQTTDVKNCRGAAKPTTTQFTANLEADLGYGVVEKSLDREDRKNRRKLRKLKRKCRRTNDCYEFH